MSNSWFQFKQFTIQQDRCAMKVGTDGVLLGAWSAKDTATQILDIGTGTGLIALMLAQKNPTAKIDAIEIDQEAAHQAIENVNHSPWSANINVQALSLQEFQMINQKTYDLIVSNPPFFENCFASENKQRQTARHSNALNFETLIQIVSEILDKKGRFNVILPFQASAKFIDYSLAVNLFLNHRVDVFPTLKSEPKRALLSFSFFETDTKYEKLIIEPTERHQYSKAFADLLKDYYTD